MKASELRDAPRRREEFRRARAACEAKRCAGGGFARFYLNEGDLSTLTTRYNYLVTQVTNETARMGSGDLTGCTTAPGRTSLETLQVCRNNANVDVENATTLRYVSIGVMGAGAVVANEEEGQ